MPIYVLKNHPCPLVFDSFKDFWENAVDVFNFVHTV